MIDRWRNVGAAASVLGGGLLFVGSIPAGWYGSEPTVSYLFNPAFGSPLWIERVLMPFLEFLGTAALLLAVGTLVYRDWQTGRSVKWGGSITLFGGASFLIGLYGPDLLAPQGAPAGPIPELGGVVLFLWGGFLLLVGGLLLGVGYFRAGRRRLGVTLVGFLPAGILLGMALPAWIGELASSVPVVVLGAILAWELAVREPLSSER